MAHPLLNWRFLAKVIKVNGVLAIVTIVIRGVLQMGDTRSPYPVP